jgi:hypothetical protein
MAAHGVPLCASCAHLTLLLLLLLLFHAHCCLFHMLQVRWSACQALGQMCTDLGPDLQTKCGAGVLPALLAAMDDFANPRVQVRQLDRIPGVYSL